MAEEQNQTPAPVAPKVGPEGIVKPIAKFASEAGPYVELLPGGVLRFSEDFEPNDATRQILEHLCPRMALLMQVANIVGQVVGLDAMGTVKLLTASTPEQIKNVLNAKKALLGLLEQFEAMNTPAEG